MLCVGGGGGGVFFFFQAEGGIRGSPVSGVQACALPIWAEQGTGLRRGRAPLDPPRFVIDVQAFYWHGPPTCARVSPSMLRVGMIGLGGIARAHCDAIAELDGVSVVACADLLPAQRDA